MQRAVIKLLATFFCATLVFLFGKLIFISSNHTLYAGITASGVISILSHGLTMDLSMAGYVSALPALVLCVANFTGSKGIADRILKIYFCIIALVVSMVILLDSALYGYWQFKLDSTPFFYFLSSPAAAFASAEWWHFIVLPLSWLLLASAVYFIFYFPVIKWSHEIAPLRGKQLIVACTATILATALLFIPIRGGVTVSTMNLSRAYFSDNQRMNHAAVNPMFSLMYSLSHQNNFADQFRFMPAKEAAALFSELNDKSGSLHSDSLLKNNRPDIYLIILESFSSHLFPTLGGESVAVKLDSIAREGLLFTRFFANSFRTDRGIPSIISAYPGQPTTSIMKFVNKTENLPSLSKQLKTNGGYSTTYYYGGDANFTNMKAYLVSAGFDKIISDVDFPVTSRLSKWGAHDEVVFSRILDELTPYNPEAPALRVVQTSSSHEPFEVPYDDKGRFADRRAKAFAYADSCAAGFIDKLHSMPQWENSIVILVPDHYGAYPDLDDPTERHKIPLIMTGGALAKKGTLDIVGSQIDLTATLLSAMGIDHSDFPFSRNMLNPQSPHFAFFADPSLIGFITENEETVFNLDASRLENGSDSVLPYAKAFLQTLYDDLSKR